MKKIFLILTSAVFLLTACHSFPDHPSRKNQLPSIYPDYAGVTIPVDIAPLDFNYCGGRFECMDVVVKGSKGGELHSNGSVAEFDVKDWHHLTE